jgi:hypothetical protein
MALSLRAEDRKFVQIADVSGGTNCGIESVARIAVAFIRGGLSTHAVLNSPRIDLGRFQVAIRP